MIVVGPIGEQQSVKPLDRLRCFGSEELRRVVVDSLERMVGEAEPGQPLEFIASGAPGRLEIRAMDESGVVRDRCELMLRAETSIRSSNPKYVEFMEILRNSMVSGDEDTSRVWRGKQYRFFVYWLRDHVHVLKGMKYFSDAACEGVDLFAESQRDDGMIWDFAIEAGPPTFWDTFYKPRGFAWTDGGVHFVRMPVEADVEYLFVEGVYAGWMQSANDDWMNSRLDQCIRAMQYTMQTRLRWSPVYDLVRRTYTIDTWDFTAIDEHLDPLGPQGRLIADENLSKFGAMFGDSTGFAASCDLLASMLDVVGRTDEANDWRRTGAEVRQRIIELAFNGRHFRHHVPEDASVKRDFGVDESIQISLSNSYSVNRNLPSEVARPIVETYRDLSKNLPDGSPGEWYGIYPPFERGFYDDARPWQYVNGGVLPLVAGELARGAFALGFEEYGVDILDRVLALAKQHGDHIYFAYTGAFPELPRQEFQTIDLSAKVNMSRAAPGQGDLHAWMLAKEAGNDISQLPAGDQEFGGVPFAIPMDGAVLVAEAKALAMDIPIHGRIGCMYLLHAVSQIGASKVACAVRWVYEDGSRASCYLKAGEHVTGWWYPEPPPGHVERTRLAWRGPNDVCPNVGLCWYALDNPCPEREVSHVEFLPSADGTLYALVGLTLGRHKAPVPESPISGGGPDNWSAAAVMAAFMEGLAGIVDTEPGYQSVTVTPQWALTDVQDIQVVAHLPASNGYVAYRWQSDDKGIRLELAGSGERAKVNILLQDTRDIVIEVNGKEVNHVIEDVHAKRYAGFEANLLAGSVIQMRYAL
ncbi:MAG: hypothetical protein ACK4XJ_00715 [Fimbriimonadaceae bacterium]